jgi:hypothetical protein
VAAVAAALAQLAGRRSMTRIFASITLFRGATGPQTGFSPLVALICEDAFRHGTGQITDR